MRTSERGTAFIKHWEGLRLTPYYCQAGVLTIGYGHTNRSRTYPPVTPGMRIDEQQADAILRNDLAAHEARVSKACGELPQAMFDMLVEHDFNTGGLYLSDGQLCGVGRAAIKGDPQAVARELARWIYYTDPATGQKLVSQGLVNRRQAAGAYVMNGVYAAVQQAPWQTTVTMPQEVAEPPPPKPMYESPTGNVSASLGGGGGLTAGVEVANAASQASMHPGGFSWLRFLLVLAQSPTFWLAVGTVAGAAYLWFGHRHRLRWGHA